MSISGPISEDKYAVVLTEQLVLSLIKNKRRNNSCTSKAPSLKKEPGAKESQFH